MPSRLELAKQLAEIHGFADHEAEDVAQKILHLLNRLQFERFTKQTPLVGKTLPAPLMPNPGKV